MGVNNVDDDNCFTFCMWVTYHITYSISTNKLEMKFNPNSEKMEEIYKTDNFIKYSAFGASLFVFFDLNTHFQLEFVVNVSRGQF